MITSRRSFITGLVSFVAAPAIVKAEALMPVKVIVPDVHRFIFRQSIPRGTWRQINYGAVDYGKSPMWEAIDALDALNKWAEQEFALQRLADGN